MSADSMRVELWQAYCIECGWWGDQLFSEEAADLDADDHDNENHPEVQA